MSNVIDSRIVEMKFDNKQFESAVSTSMGTLAKLKESLNFDKTGSNFLSNLTGALNKVDFSPISSALDSAGAKFSVFEEIAIGALRRIGEMGVDFLAGKIKELSLDQITAGMTKYEEKTTAVQTIMAATASQFEDTGVQMEYVNGQLEKLNWFTDETSYNFVDMVGNIGKFTSNGIALADAVTSMQGIANWAAISGQNAATASRAMYNLSQAIGTGSVKLIDWRSIENANMATQEFKQTVLDTAVSVGTLKKTANGYATAAKGTAVSVRDFNSALSEGWFTKDVLTTVLDRYGSVTNQLYDLSEASGATATDILQLVEAQKNGTISAKDFEDALGDDATISLSNFKKAIEALASEENEFGIKAFKAAQEAKTLTDAIDATKDAVSTGWMKSFELIFGDYEHARVLWTDVANGLWDIFAAGSEARNELLKDWGNNKWENLTKDITRAGVSLTDFEAVLTESLKESGVSVDGLISKYGSLGKAIESGAINSKTLSEAIKVSIDDLINNGSGSLESAEDKLKEIQDVVHQVWSGALGNGDERKKALEEMGYDYDTIQKLAEKGADYVLKLEDISDIELKALGLAEEEIEALRIIQNDEARLMDLAGESGRAMLAEGITNALSSIAEHLQLIRSTWADVFGPLTANTLRKITAAFRDFTAGLAVFEEDGETLTSYGKDLEAILWRIFEAGRNVVEFFKNIGRVIGQFAVAMEPAISAARALALALIDLFNSVMGRVNAFLGRLDFSSAFEAFGLSITTIIEWIIEKVDALREKVDDAKIGEKIYRAAQYVKAASDLIGNRLSGLFAASNHSSALSFDNLLKKIGNSLRDLKTLFQPVIDKLKEFWEALKVKLDLSNITSIGDAIQHVLGAIGDIAGGAFHGLLDGIDRLNLGFGDLIKAFIGTKVAGKLLTNILGGNSGGVKKSITDLIKSVKEIVDNFGEKGLMGTLFGENGFGSGKSGFDKFAENIKKIGSAMLMAAGGVLALGVALLVFNTAVSMDENGKGMMAMITSMGLLVGVLAVLSKLGPKIIFAGIAMAAAAVGIAALAGALALFTLVGKMDGTVTALLAMFATLTMVVGALAVLAQAGPMIIVASAAILVASVALIALAGALALFTLAANMDGTTTALIAMFTTLTLVAGGLMVLSTVALKSVAAATAILIVSVALIALAGALALFTAVVNMDGTTKGLIAMAVALGVVVAALAGLAMIGPMVLVAAAAMALAAVAVVAIAAGLAAGAVAIAALGVALTVLIGGIGIAVGAAIGAIGTGVGTALSAIGKGIGDIFSGIGAGVGDGIAAIGAGIATANTLIGGSIENLGTNIGNGLQNVALGVDGASTIIGAAFDRLGLSVGTTIENFGAKVGSAIEGVGQSIARAGESISGVGTSIASVGDGIAHFGESVKSLSGVDLLGIGHGLIEFSKGVKKLNGVSFNVDPSGIISYVSALASFSQLVPMIAAVSQELEMMMLNLGQMMGINLANSLGANASNVANSAKALGDSAYLTLDGYYNTFFIIGENMAIGLANGIVSRSSTVNNAASSVAKNAAQSARNAAKVRSPSRVFAQIGEYMSQGLANGLKDKANEVKESAEFIAKTAINSVQSLADTDFSNEITITPVLDLSDAQNGISQLDGLLNNRSGSFSLSTNGIDKLLNIDEVDKGASEKNSRINLDALYSRIEALSDHLDNLQIVVDTGALVGATSAKMDGQFGIMSMRRGRGN